MTVYKLIQKLAKYDPNAVVSIKIFAETTSLLEEVKEDCADGKENTWLDGGVYDVIDVSKKEVRITVDVY